MALGLSRREQWTLIGVAGVILAGLGYSASQAPALAPADSAIVRNADGSAAPGLSSGPQPGAITTDATGRWQTLAVLPNHGGKTPALGPPNASAPSATVATWVQAPTPVPPQARSAGTSSPAAIAPSPAPLPRGLDLNRATEPELENLPGIGAVRAKDILALRQQMGGRFQSIDDLRKVKGIGPATFERIKPLVFVPPLPGPASYSNAPPPSAMAASNIRPNGSQANPTTAGIAQAPAAITFAPSIPPARINVNRATEQELEELTGVGPVIAQRIIQYRAQHGAIRSLADLEAVKGIGPATAHKMAPQLAF